MAAKKRSRQAAQPRRAPRKEPRVRDIDAIWLDGPVPAGYWQVAEHRRTYFRWLGQRLGFRRTEDWYQITTNDLKRNRGGGVLAQCWQNSAIYAVKECFPDYDWKEWLFHCTPRAFWHDRRNHRAYMKWLGEQLGITRTEQWYQVNNQDFKEHKGAAFLSHYNSTVSEAIMRHHPRYPWKEWLFSKTPKGFWDQPKNRRRYMKWLGEQMGVGKLDDWSDVTGADFEQHGGNQLIKFYDGSPLEAVRDCYPRHAWKEWMFARVPAGFWQQRVNRRRYLDWLGKQLGYRRPKDWYQVRREQLREHYGGGLLLLYGSYFDLLREYLPKLDWDSQAARWNH